MSICACCNRILDPNWAYKHNLCPVCTRSGCDGHRARHSDTELDVHDERRRDQARQKAAEKAHA